VGVHSFKVHIWMVSEIQYTQSCLNYTYSHLLFVQ